MERNTNELGFGRAVADKFQWLIAFHVMNQNFENVTEATSTRESENDKSKYNKKIQIYIRICFYIKVDKRAEKERREK